LHQNLRNSDLSFSCLFFWGRSFRIFCWSCRGWNNNFQCWPWDFGGPNYKIWAPFSWQKKNKYCFYNCHWKKKRFNISSRRLMWLETSVTRRARRAMTRKSKLLFHFVWLTEYVTYRARQGPDDCKEKSAQTTVNLHCMIFLENIIPFIFKCLSHLIFISTLIIYFIKKLKL
jgi:hypothetical protein